MNVRSLGFATVCLMLPLLTGCLSLGGNNEVSATKKPADGGPPTRETKETKVERSRDGTDTEYKRTETYKRD